VALLISPFLFRGVYRDGELMWCRYEAAMRACGGVVRPGDIAVMHAHMHASMFRRQSSARKRRYAMMLPPRR